MITRDGLKKKKCFLQDDKLIIDGESYSIESLKSIRQGLLALIVICIIGAITYAFMLLLINVIIIPKILNMALKNIIILLFISPFIAICLLIINLFYNTFKYMDCWAINYYHILFIEKDDYPELDANLKQIEKKLLINKPKRHIPTKVVILLISGMILVSSSPIFAKINEILMPIPLICGLLIIYLSAFLHGLEAWNRSKWKK